MSASEKFDVIVIGVGSMGSSTCYHLAKEGIKVLGLEQFDIPNELSSHTGQSRIIRQAYFEHSDYVPLLERAYTNWQALEADSGNQVFYKTGLLYAGHPDHPMMSGIKAAADTYAINLEKHQLGQIAIQYPYLKIPNDYEILTEPDAGFITPGIAIKAYVESAIQNGAIIKPRVKVESWKRINHGFEVITTAGIYYGEKIIFTSGPWAGKLLPSMSSALKITRQVLAWVNTNNAAAFELGNFPCWMIADEQYPGVFYGFPMLSKNKFEGPSGFKIAYHYPGEITDPDLINRTTTKEDEQLLIDFMHHYFPNQYLSTQEMKTCMYTNSPDEHFILDFLPGYDEDVLVATGFSGHGFKFASVIGEIMCDLAIKGENGIAD